MIMQSKQAHNSRKYNYRERDVKKCKTVLYGFDARYARKRHGQRCIEIQH